MSKPSVAQLELALRKLVKWTQFALHLPGIESEDIDIIEANRRDDLIEQKIALYKKWLKVHPDASWNDVVETLEKVDENVNAREIREKYLSTSGAETPSTEASHNLSISSSTAMSPSSSSSAKSDQTNHSNQVEVSKKVVKKLDKSHRRFRDLVRNVQIGVESKIEGGKLTTKIVIRQLHEERAYSIPELESVQTTDDLFKAIRPHYNFLNCYLIVSLSSLLSGIILKEATAYEKSIEKLMKTTEIRHVKNKLKQYHSTDHSIISSSTRIIKIVVEESYGTQCLGLMQVLIEYLFPVKNPGELPWYNIVSGSIIMTFLALEHMMPSLIESSRKKTEFMRLMGVISLTIGDELVWHKKDNETVLSFEDSLIRATLANEIEAAEFLLQHARVDINTTNTNSTLIAYDDAVFRETGAEHVFRSYSYVFMELVKDAKEDLESRHVENLANTVATIEHPSSNILNTSALVNVAPLLSDKTSMKIKKFKGAIENVKKRGMITDLETNLEDYFPTPFPDSIEVIITLHSVWSNCSVWNVEQLGQLILTPTLFYQLQWYRVDRRDGSIRVCLLADGKIVDSLKESVSENEMRTSMLGIMSIQIDDTVMVVNDYSDGYTFDNATELARAIGDDELSGLLQQIWQSPREYKEVSTVDENNNFFFSPDPDSTPLMIACCNDNSQLVQLLLDHNADPNTRNRRDNSALIYSTGNTKIFQMLLDHGADLFQPNFFNYTALHFASWIGNLKVVNIILELDKEDNRLLETRSSNERRPLDVACENRHVEIIKRLLEAKANPNIQDQDGVTPLLSASWTGEIEIVEALLKARANPNMADNERSTPLHGASRHGHTEVVEKLLEANAKVNEQEDEGWTPLYGASHYGHTAIVEKLLLAKASTNIPDDKGLTPLNVASRYGRTEIVGMLLQAKADPNSKDLNGNTPLMSATQNDRTNIVELLLTAENIDLDLKNNDEQTVLMMACAKSLIRIAELLLDAGADADLKNKDGKTALDLAMETGDNQFTERLCTKLFD